MLRTLIKQIPNQTNYSYSFNLDHKAFLPPLAGAASDLTSSCLATSNILGIYSSMDFPNPYVYLHIPPQKIP